MIRYLCFQMLLKKVDALTKAIEVETKKAKREAAAREKENALAMLNEESKQSRKTNLPRRFGHLLLHCLSLSFDKIYIVKHQEKVNIYMSMLCYAAAYPIHVASRGR